MTDLTEQEAKTKWCPFMRTPAHSQTVPPNRCIASECMAWRWHWISTDKGYCGIAHNPIGHRVRESAGIELNDDRPKGSAT